MYKRDFVRGERFLLRRGDRISAGDMGHPRIIQRSWILAQHVGDKSSFVSMSSGARDHNLWEADYHLRYGYVYDTKDFPSWPVSGRIYSKYEIVCVPPATRDALGRFAAAS